MTYKILGYCDVRKKYIELGLVYALVKDDTGLAVVTVTFHKNQVPTHTF